MVLVKDWPFFHLFFLGNIGQENVFCDILEQKNAFLGYKNKKLKKSKNWGFSKGVNPWFSSKIDHFPIVFFFFCNMGKESVFYDILQRKKAFQGYKNKKFKQSKNWDFSRGVNPWFWSKLAIFLSFIFRQYKPQKCVLRYSRTNKRLSRLYKPQLQNVDKLRFFQKG